MIYIYLVFVPQIRPLADIVHFKYAHTYLLTYFLFVVIEHITGNMTTAPQKIKVGVTGENQFPHLLEIDQVLMSEIIL